jgi:hypothetical protein
MSTSAFATSCGGPADQSNLLSGISSERCFERIIGTSPAIQGVLEQAIIVAPSLPVPATLAH